VQQYTTIGRSLGAENRRVLLRHVQVRDLMELARKGETELNAVPPDSPCPGADFTKVYQIPPKGSSINTIRRDLQNLRRWEERWRPSNRCVGGSMPWLFASLRKSTAPIASSVSSAAWSRMPTRWRSQVS
jgi:hypothetical protein